MSNDTTQTRLIIPALAPLYANLSRWSYPIIRFFTGLILVPHGAQKLFGWFGGGGLEGTGVTSPITWGSSPAYSGPLSSVAQSFSAACSSRSGF